LVNRMGGDAAPDPLTVVINWPALANQ
jgi:hypothetical protein